ncbi:acyl-CoA thioesterase [Actinomadura craniellae]|uniref:Acyl-CoA thioesterase n=1 Tax=Actinomadura craniellae TaxID=2231787 RepID=A0A365H148_9ACTN|nr:thioesterase family protein [Actinomadura craniellae]RAY12756.1 acyl-CoA thioesterase [Actinomadura craniellae]
MAQPLPTIDYGHVEPMPVYFDDLDPMGLLHNSRYAVILERTLATFWSQQSRTEDNDLFSHPDAFLAVAEFSITYRTPVRGAGTVGVHFWVDKLGRTSAVYGYRVISLDGETVHAEGRRVHIRLDPETMRPAPWSPPTRAVFETLFK